jgi:hypothetical protein
MFFDGWLKTLRDKAESVEFPHDDSTIKVATKAPRVAFPVWIINIPDSNGRRPE